ncbi:MAG: L-seryl-tRNA(Sec) selenium transferase [Anaerolineales bacterium]|nr:L-seryl-tRNA(Sec) selenium transferase [Anaerolineales bacterium]
MSLRDLPSVDSVLQTPAASELSSIYGRPLTLQAIRHTLENCRLSHKQGDPAPGVANIIQSAGSILDSWTAPTLRPVINATGVIIHTNLGRSPLSAGARQAVLETSLAYSTLEYSLSSGKRGKREKHAEEQLKRLTSAEAALVVNNNAAAVLLALSALARRKEVLIARSQLVEIGGGFRIPDVMRLSGARLVEVGTTNRVHLSDYENAITDRTALILLAHHSNFKIVGFTSEPDLKDLCELGKRFNITVVHDLGSGTLFDTAQFGLGHEPTVQESLAEGTDIVCFSGDKLLGGPQAGILIGKKTVIERLRRYQLARAVRPDKMCLAALSATLLHYLKDEALETIPIWQMIAATTEQQKQRVEAWIAELGFGTCVPGESTVGGGSLPEETLPTWLLALPVRHPDAAARHLRTTDSPVITRIGQDQILLDPRTVLPEQEADLLSGVRSLRDQVISS